MPPRAASPSSSPPSLADAQPAKAAPFAGLFQPPDCDREQRPTVGAVDAELDRAAANLAVLDVRAILRRHVDACLEALSAPRTAHRDELLGRRARSAVRTRLVHRLEPVEPIDAVRVEARDAPLEALELHGLAPGHRARIRHYVESPGFAAARRGCRPRGVRGRA